MTLKFKQPKKYEIRKEYPKFPEIHIQWMIYYYQNEHHLVLRPKDRRTVRNYLFILWLSRATCLKYCWSIKGASRFLSLFTLTFHADKEKSSNSSSSIASLSSKLDSKYEKYQQASPTPRLSHHSIDFPLKIRLSSFLSPFWPFLNIYPFPSFYEN